MKLGVPKNVGVDPTTTKKKRKGLDTVGEMEKRKNDNGRSESVI